MAAGGSGAALERPLNAFLSSLHDLVSEPASGAYLTSARVAAAADIATARGLSASGAAPPGVTVHDGWVTLVRVVGVGAGVGASTQYHSHPHPHPGGLFYCLALS